MGSASLTAKTVRAGTGQRKGRPGDQPKQTLQHNLGQIRACDVACASAHVCVCLKSSMQATSCPQEKGAAPRPSTLAWARQGREGVLVRLVAGSTGRAGVF
jgi:hypothetical protein